MSQRDSGYKRKERDLYETPEWVTEALLPHLPYAPKAIWEPACATGKMVAPLKKTGAHVIGTDIDQGRDFLKSKLPLAPLPGIDAIITNPPYELASEFIGRALDLISETSGIVAMLLRTDFDHAKTRAHFFGGNSTFAKKVVLTRRIKWFEDSDGSPSFNHAWFIWNWKHSGAPVLAYGPR